MLVTDTDLLIDLLGPSRDHHGAAVEFVDDHRDVPLGIPTPVLYELARHEARTDYGHSVEELLAALDWGEPLSLTVAAIRHAAFIDADLHDRGEPIAQFDVLIAGIARSVGGTLVARDDHYERIENLDTDSYL